MANPLCLCGCGREVKRDSAKWLNGHHTRSEEWKIKHRLAFLGKPNTPLIGRKYSKEHREALSRAHKGKPLSESHREAIGLGQDRKSVV